MDISHLKQKFIDEANDLLSGLDHDLLELENSPENKQLIDQVFRSMHTIKGASGMYGQDNIMNITHELETLYDLVRNQKLKVTKELIDLTFSTADHIRNLLIDQDLKNKENFDNHSLILSAINHFLKRTGNVTSPKKNTITTTNNSGIETWQVLLYPDESMIFRGINLSIIFSDLYSLGKCVLHNNLEEETITFWNIFIVTDKGRSSIEDILLFISDYCKINKVADFDIFDEKELIKKNKENEEHDINYQFTSNKINNDNCSGTNYVKPESLIIKKNNVLSPSRINVDASTIKVTF